jgi:ABC-type nitrate/sulfonate/bicarbonate transport system permease component
LAESEAISRSHAMPHRSRGRLSRIDNVSVIRQILSVVAVCAVWELQGQIVKNQFLPPLSTILMTAADLVGAGTMWGPLRETTVAWVVSVLLSAVVGGAIGFGMGAFRVLDGVLGPAVDNFFAIPPVAFLPLWIIWFGPNEPALIPFSMILGVPAMAINARAGIRNTDQDLVEMARALGANDRQRFIHVMFPSSLPLALSGLRLLLGRCFIGVVIGEMLLTGTGVGVLLTFYGNAFSGNQLWAVTLIVLAMSYLIGVFSNLLDSVVLGWRQNQVRSGE